MGEFLLHLFIHVQTSVSVTMAAATDLIRFSFINLISWSSEQLNFIKRRNILKYDFQYKVKKLCKMYFIQNITQKKPKISKPLPVIIFLNETKGSLSLMSDVCGSSPALAVMVLHLNSGWLA